MAPKVITIIGSLNTDLVTVTSRVPAGGETLTAKSFSTGAGGKGANQAVACARMTRSNPARVSDSSPDIVVKMVGAVGSDSFGTDLIAGMKADYIDTSGVQTVQGQVTGVAVILVEESTGENRILLNPGANHSLQPEDFMTAENLGSPTPELIILQLEIPIETVLQILLTAKKAGIPVMLNPAPAVELPREVFDGLDHLVLNETEAAIMLGENVAKFESLSMDWERVTNDFLRRGVKNVIVTLGSKGAYFSNALDKGNMVPAAKVSKVVDTTAAGDTFIGAYAVRVVGRKKIGTQDWLTEAAQFACEAAGRTVEKAGAQSAIPWADEVHI